MTPADDIQELIDRYSIAGADLLNWLSVEEVQNQPKKPHEVASWANDIACRAYFAALREAKEAVSDSNN